METIRFKTKTTFIDRSDAQLSQYPIGLDIGYSAVKIFSPNKVAIFPSYAKPYINKGTIGKLADNFIVYTDLDKNESWLVGEYAQTDTTFNDAIESDEAQYGRMRWHDPMIKVIARTGLGVALMSNKYGNDGKRKIVVQTGLPPKFTDDSKLVKRVLAGRHHFSVKIGSNAPEEFDFELTEDDIRLILQPMGTLYSVAINNDHRYAPQSVEYMNKSCLIFDAGFGTFDLFLLKNHMIKDSQTFSNLGMKQVFEETAEKIYEKYNVRIGVTDMQKYLKEGQIIVSDGLFSSYKAEFGDILEQVSAEVCRRALEKTAQIYKLSEIDYLVITGGTGAAWEKTIRQTLSQMSTLSIVSGNQNETDLPYVFSNVRGYYMNLYSKIKQSEKK